MSESIAAEFKKCVLDASYKERDEDWAGAYKLWVRAEGLLASAPDSEKDGMRMAWRSSEGARHIARLEKLIQQTRPVFMQRVPIQFTRPRVDETL